MQRWGLIMAGGASRRMGTDKLALPRHPGGASILAHVADTLLAVADAVWLLVPPDGSGEGPRVAERLGPRVRVIPDAAFHAGPLRAVAHAWPRDADVEAVWLVAGDLPGLAPAVLCHLAEMLASTPEADAVLAVRGGRWQPLVGCYRARAGDAFEAAAAAGEVRLAPALERLRVMTWDPVAAGWPEWCVKPVHTPEDYAAWLAWWQSGGEQSSEGREAKTDAARNSGGTGGGHAAGA